MARLVACHAVNKEVPSSSLRRSVNSFFKFLSFFALASHRFDFTGGRFMTCWSFPRSKVGNNANMEGTLAVILEVRWR